MSSDTVYDERIAKLSAAYKLHLVETVNQLKELRVELGDQNQFANVYESLRHEVHRLAGSAGLFGLQNVGEAADVVETNIVTAKKNDFEPETVRTVLQQLDGLIEELNRSLK